MTQTSTAAPALPAFIAIAYNADGEVLATRAVRRGTDENNAAAYARLLQTATAGATGWGVDTEESFQRRWAAGYVRYAA